MRRKTLPFLISASLAAAGLTVLLHPSPAVAGSGTPGFTSYVAPEFLTDRGLSGEPSIGINPNTGAIMYQAYRTTYKITMDAGGVAHWRDVTALAQTQKNMDPILATDAVTGRTWAGGLAESCSNLSYTDDDGASWTQMLNPCTGTFDHETIGSGPWHGTPPLGASYSRAVYYCAQYIVNACATSSDGGLTFGAPAVGQPGGLTHTPVVDGCIGTHGHVKVSADGTAYVPNHHCNNFVGGNVSTDNGATWNTYLIPGSVQPLAGGFDPSVATTPDNTLYQAWGGLDGHPYLSISSTHGTTWAAPVDLGATTSPAVLNAGFQNVVTGDNGRVAVAFLGSTTGGDAQSENWHGVYDLYVAYSYDAGATWTTVKATSDPVQRGFICMAGVTCNSGRNLLDFMDATLSPDGRVVVAYADGCVDACAGAGGAAADSSTAVATFSYQSAGQGLLGSNDGAWSTGSPSPDPTPPSTDVLLTSGVAYAGPYPAANGWVFHKIAVPVGAASLTVTLHGASCPPAALTCTDLLDLYVKGGTHPTQTSYEGEPGSLATSNETVVIAAPTAGWYYAGVYTGYTGSGAPTYTLTASVT